MVVASACESLVADHFIQGCCVSGRQDTLAVALTEYDYGWLV